MKKVIVVSCYLYIHTLLNAQYVPQSEYLITPEKNLDIIINNAKYWKEYKDNVYGGFHNYVEFNNTISSSRKKSFNGQSRLAYAFTRAFSITGDTTYLEQARHALDFLYTYGWDKENGGWYAVSYEDGTLSYSGWPDSRFNKYKAIFQQLYSLLGISSYYEATKDTIHKTWLEKGLQSNENLWDNSDNYGYFHESNLNWSNPNGKGFTGAVDAITTHMLLTYLITGEDKYLTRLTDLANNIVYHLYQSKQDPDVVLGFPEDYDSNWNIDRTSSGNHTGHVLKAAWCLLRIYSLVPNETYKTVAYELIDEIWNKAYDRTYGGPFTNLNWKTGAVTPGKVHWSNEQAYTSAIFGYLFADSQDAKDIYLQIADETIEFHMTKMIDPNNGSTYVQNSSDGLSPSGAKGSYYNVAYHTCEFAYYGYLYGNLFYRHQPATLYYYFRPQNNARNIILNPTSANFDQLKIKSVKLDGENFSNFNHNSRELMLDKNIGGVFEVQFELENNPTDITEISVENDTEKTFKIYKNYPNPWHSSTTFKYILYEAKHVQIDVMDITGKKITTFVNKLQQPGSYSLQFHQQEFLQLVPGIYFYKIAIDNYSEIYKMIFTGEGY